MLHNQADSLADPPAPRNFKRGQAAARGARKAGATAAGGSAKPGKRGAD